MSTPTKRKNNFVNNPISKKINKQLFIYTEDDINMDTLFEDSEEEKVKDHVIIKKQINCIQDLIDLGLSYDCHKTYNINLEILFRLVIPAVIIYLISCFIFPRKQSKK